MIRGQARKGEEDEDENENETKQRKPRFCLPSVNGGSA
jgi:hypothetical protein